MDSGRQSVSISFDLTSAPRGSLRAQIPNWVKLMRPITHYTINDRWTAFRKFIMVTIYCIIFDRYKSNETNLSATFLQDASETTSFELIKQS